jgi:transposase InsO family protein
MTREVKMYFVKTKLRWLELLADGYTKTELAKIAGVHRRTLRRWGRQYARYGEDGLVPQPKRPRSCPWQTPRDVVELIRQLRRSRRRPLGPIPISVKLRKRHGITLYWRTVAKVLKREGLITKRVRVKPKDAPLRHPVTFPGELVEIDVKYAAKFNGHWTYQYTATDCFTRMRCLRTYAEQTNRMSVRFLETAVHSLPFPVTAVKTDNHSTFTNRYTGYAKSADPLNPKLHIFDRTCQRYGITHYLIDTGKPQQNGKVERSHRTDQEELYDVERFASLYDLRRKQKHWLHYYNHGREHQGIGNLTPFEKFKQFADNAKVA